MLFVSPPGRVANWTNWSLVGLTKHQWGGLHIWFSTVFLFVAIVHEARGKPASGMSILQTPRNCQSLNPVAASCGYKR